MEASGQLSADEWKLVAEHRAKSGQGDGGNTPVPTERVSGSDGVYQQSAGEEGGDGEPPRKDRFGYSDEFYDLRERFGAVVDEDADFDIGQRPYQPGELNVKGFRG